MKLTELIHNGTIRKDQDIFLGTGCSFFFIGTASELRGYARMNKLSLLGRKVIEHYPRLQRDGYVVIIEGEEAGSYWYKSEFESNKGLKKGVTHSKHIDGLMNIREICANYEITNGSVAAHIKNGHLKCQKINGLLYVTKNDIEDFMKNYKKGNRWGIYK